MRYATVNNIKLSYESNGAKYPVTLVQGFGSKKKMWITLIQGYLNIYLIGFIL